jgi:hypothetical protein
MKSNEENEIIEVKQEPPAFSPEVKVPEMVKKQTTIVDLTQNSKKSGDSRCCYVF